LVRRAGGKAVARGCKVAGRVAGRVAGGVAEAAEIAEVVDRQGKLVGRQGKLVGRLGLVDESRAWQ